MCQRLGKRKRIECLRLILSIQNLYARMRLLMPSEIEMIVRDINEIVKAGEKRIYELDQG